MIAKKIFHEKLTLDGGERQSSVQSCSGFVNSKTVDRDDTIVVTESERDCFYFCIVLLPQQVQIFFIIFNTLFQI